MTPLNLVILNVIVILVVPVAGLILKIIIVIVKSIVIRAGVVKILYKSSKILLWLYRLFPLLLKDNFQVNNKNIIIIYK